MIFKAVCRIIFSLLALFCFGTGAFIGVAHAWKYVNTGSVDILRFGKILYDINFQSQDIAWLNPYPAWLVFFGIGAVSIFIAVIFSTED